MAEPAKKRILVVDDDPGIRAVIRELLFIHSFEVFEAEDGRQGIDLARKQYPDLILCDIKMPDVDGYTVLNTLRNDAQTANIPIILLTGFSDQYGMREGMQLGADDYLTKPFKAKDLFAAISTRLKRSEALKQESERRLAELRGHISHTLPHELRTPLQSIMGFADILAEEYNGMSPTEVGELASHIRAAAKRLHHLTENMLTYAQLEILDTTTRRQYHSPVASIVQAVAGELATEYARGADLMQEIEGAEVQVHEEDLAKIVRELLSNSLKFSAAGTPVAVVGHRSGQGYQLQFYNEGRGMTPEQIGNVGAFSQFGRKVYEQQGAGLGLTIAKRLSEINGGTLEIHSVPDKETTVRVILPLASDQP